MSQRVQVLLIDDLDGSEANEKIHFALDNHAYQIDLNAQHAAELRDFLRRYIDAGEKVPSSHRRRPSSATDKDRLTRIRTWAAQNGHQVSSRGRISTEIIRLYEARNNA